MCVGGVSGCMYDGVFMWRSEDTLWGSLLSFHYVDPRDWTQILSLGDKSLCPPKKTLEFSKHIHIPYSTRLKEL